MAKNIIKSEISVIEDDKPVDSVLLGSVDDEKHLTVEVNGAKVKVEIDELKYALDMIVAFNKSKKTGLMVYPTADQTKPISE
jgi:hypothetical protein